MAWEWSHTEEAYAAVEHNIRQQPREWLEVVFAEWRAAQDNKGNVQTGTHNFNQKKYERALAYAKNPEVTNERLADFIWEKANELRICTNGGWQAWCCPSGCGCHLVPFDIKEAAA
jgi:hypothetical protein